MSNVEKRLEVIEKVIADIILQLNFVTNAVNAIVENDPGYAAERFKRELFEKFGIKTKGETDDCIK